MNTTQVPPFASEFPSIEDMSPDQFAFFSLLRRKLEHGEYLAVDGNTSYLLLCVYELLSTHSQLGYRRLYERLLELADAYQTEQTFVACCRRWSYDCLLGARMFDDFLLLSEPAEVFGTTTHFSNLRCNVFYLLDRPPTAVDLLKMSGITVTPFTRKYPAAFRDHLEAAFAEDAEKNGPWLDRLLHAQGDAKTYGSWLFEGTPIDHPPVPFDYYCFYAAYKHLDVLRGVARDAENRLRAAHCMPKIGESWQAETKLFYAIREAFPSTVVVHHGTPPWLGRQHLDVWIPRWKIAVEYHGPQHFEPLGFCGGTEGLAATAERDARKRALCEEHSVILIVATPELPHQVIVEQVTGAHLSRRRAVKQRN